MRTVFVDPGSLRTELTVEAPTPVSDGMGGQIEGWSEVATVFGLVETVRATGRDGAGQALEQTEHRITLRARQGIEPGHRLRLGSRKLVVETVADPDETGRYLVCRTREERT